MPVGAKIGMPPLQWHMGAHLLGCWKLGRLTLWALSILVQVLSHWLQEVFVFV